VLQIEATLVKGRGGVTLTGKLGDVMQESAQAALTCIRARAERLGMSLDFIRKRDLHIHIPGRRHSERWTFRLHNDGDGDGFCVGTRSR
jgi:ATP-dependent Lon protease